MEIVENRDTDTLKQIIEKHVLPGNYITTDAWKGYTFLDYPYSWYIHDVYNHARGNFGSGLSSTSRIEGLWGELKALLKKIYTRVNSDNFLYFLREMEYRRNIKSLNAEKKWKTFQLYLHVWVLIKLMEFYLKKNFMILIMILISIIKN